MSKEMMLIVLGVALAVVPYLGIPGDWRAALELLGGIAVALTGFLLRGEALAREGGAGRESTFTESIPPAHNDGITSLN